VLKVVGYVRVSREEQAQDGVSLAVQAEKVRAYCGLYELDLVELIVDPGESAKTLGRPGLSLALAMLADGRAEGIVVAKLDRLTRSVADLAELLDRYFGEAAGKQLFSVGDSIDTRTAAGRLVLNVLMSVAQWERETIVERTQTALDHKRARGERIGTIPYGWRLDADGKTLILKPDEQRALDLILFWESQGKSKRWMACELDRLCFVPKAGGSHWSPSSIYRIVARIKAHPPTAGGCEHVA
jgi:DNA invertase Pin-like site-specific DNA recombinase